MRPIKREFQLITQEFNLNRHKGVDLRCVDDNTFENLPVIMTERSQILRQGIDGYGNYYLVVKPLQNTYYKEIKYIHIDKTNFNIGDIIEKDDFISFCIIGGNSKILHLHFETWGKPVGMSVIIPENPVEYFNICGINNKIKDKS